MRGFYLLSEDWRAKEESRQKQQDYRFYRLIDALYALHGQKRTLRPGILFPSLASIDEEPKQNEDTDYTQELQDMRSFMHQMASTSTMKGE